MTIPLAVVDSLPTPKPEQPAAAPPLVHLGVPTYDGRLHDGIFQAFSAACRTPLIAHVQVQSGSWLTANFNFMFAEALNQRARGITHFCLLHEDVIPHHPDWLTKMMAISQFYKADILSVVIPIKSEKGLTSTAIDEPVGDEDPHWRVRRLTMTEVYKDFSPTFTHEKLLVNTGLMLIDLRKPWVEEMWFEFEDRIVKTKEGKFVQVGFPEDWNFSRRARKLGASLFATRDVAVTHRGGGAFPNIGAWGVMEKDQ